MVLTNFECWALGGGGNQSNGDDRLTARNSVDLFNPRLVMEACGSLSGQTNDAAKTVSHISSNGYYGYAAHSIVNEQNNNVVSGGGGVGGGTNININCVNSPQFIDNEMTVDIDLDGGEFNNTANNNSKTTAGRKKRFFVDEDASTAKKCRYDNDDVEAQYCNDFFQMNTQKIGTQSCLMDTEDYDQHQQQEQMHQFQQNTDKVQLPNTMMMTSAVQQQQQQGHHPVSASHLEQTKLKFQTK